MHSRPNQRIAVLDTHILHWLRDQGVAAPKTTPLKGSKKYKDLELTFLTLADKLGEDPAILDLRIWNEYSRNGLGKTGTTCETV
jgi:thermostable 8-oxoguanine DNA glycosylase